MKLNKYIQKICCFYASDWHLTVMLLPYLSSKLQQKNSIYMMCENSIEEKIKILLGKLDIQNKEEILNLKYDNLLVAEEYDSSDKIYIVSGSEEYIEEQNEIIEKYYEDKTVNVKIINCYEVNPNNNLYEIINKNNYKCILNTKGEFDIEKNRPDFIDL